MILSRYIYSLVKNNLYFIVGLFLGLFLSVNYFHYEDELLCSDAPGALSGSEDGVGDLYTTDGYEPKFLQNKPNLPKKIVKNLQRPRYYSTELGIKEKLFVGVFTSEQNINNQATAINKTLAHLTNKIKFFITANVVKNNFNLTNIVGFTDTREILKPFHVLKYMSDNYLNDFDYYYLISDVGFVDGRKLMDVVNGISVSEDVYLGTKPETDSHYCSLDAGMLISNSVLKKVRDNLDWCVKNAFSKESYENIGRCIIHSTELKCSQNIQDQHLMSYQLPDNWNLKTDLKTVMRSENFNNAVSIYPIKDYTDFYRFQLYFARVHLESINNEIDSLRNYVTANSADDHWPAGVREDPTLPVQQPPDRFHQPRYTTINMTHNLMPDDYTNTLKHTEAEKRDLDNVVKSIALKVQNENPHLTYHSLVNGYRRFDPSKGMSYILDMNFHYSNNDDNKMVMKRMEVFKPLGKAAVLPAPYVTENTRIAFIIPIWQFEINMGSRFLRYFEAICMERKDKVFLLLVLMYPAEAASKGPDDNYGALKASALELSEKFKADGLKVAWLSIRLPASPHILDEPGLMGISILDLALRKLPLDSLVLMGRPQMEMKPDYLNRVRMNTVPGFQVYSALGFQHYHPSLSTGPTPSKTSGRFAPWDYTILSFYSRDYVAVRKTIVDMYPIVRADKDIEILLAKSYDNVQSVYEMFVKYSTNLHVFRAVEPSLTFKYDETLFCPPVDAYKNSSQQDIESLEENYVPFGDVSLTEKCLLQLSKSNFVSVAVGGRNQLAKLIFET